MHPRFILLSSVFALFVISLFVVSVFPVQRNIGQALSVVKDVSVPKLPLELPLADGSVATTYVYGSGLVAKSSDGTLSYHLQDVLSTNKLVVSDKGLMQSRFTSYPYGKPLTKESFAEQKQKYTFTGKEDDGHLMYYGARYMDARTGRFASVDPLVSTPSHYDYAGNNPLVNIDPDGRETQYRSWKQQITANIIPAMRVLALGTLTYNLAKKNYLEPQTVMSGAIVADGLLSAIGPAISLRSNAEEISNTPSADRMSPILGQIITNDIRQYCGDEGQKVAERFNSLVTAGRVFSPERTYFGDGYGNTFGIILNGVENLNKNLPMKVNAGGYFSPYYNSIVIGIPSGDYRGDLWTDVVATAGHEAKHATQGRLRFALWGFLGFNTKDAYWSIFNPLEQPARNIGERIERNMGTPERTNDNTFIDTPIRDETDHHG